MAAPKKPLVWKRIRIGCFALLVFAGMLGLGLAEDRPSEEKPATLKLLKRFRPEFVTIKPGQARFPESFRMGSADGQPSERPVHQVTLNDEFAIAKYEVPQNLYAAVMGENPSRWKGPRNSVEMVTFGDARRFCRRVTMLLQDAELLKASQTVRLPSEAEWEYCCRAGTTTAYSFGDKARKPDDTGNEASLLDAYAWHTGNAAGNDPPVGALKPNPWGLYDMHGYLWEFVADDWHPNYRNAPVDGSPWMAGKDRAARTIRGGSWQDRFPRLRSAARKAVPFDFKSDAVGFRCVLDDGE